MKIEKINENQIRCILSKKDLADRQIKLSELAFGSEKARGLFRDMIDQAHDEFGFEADDILGTIANKNIEKNIFTYILTGDKDSFQFQIECFHCHQLLLMNLYHLLDYLKKEKKQEML